MGDAVTGELTNLFAYMSEWGVSFDYGMAADDDQSNYAGYKTYILGQLQDNEIVNSMGIQGQQLVFPLARPIILKEKIGITSSVLVSTGDNGYIKQNVYSSDDSFEEGDIRKKSNLASITIGGGVMGIMGILLAVPFVAAFYRILRDDINKPFVKKA